MVNKDLLWETAEAVASSNDKTVLDTSRTLITHKMGDPGKNKKNVKSYTEVYTS